MVQSFMQIEVTTTKLSSHKLFMKCVFAQSFINALYTAFTFYVGFSKIGSAGSDSKCKWLLVRILCVSCGCESENVQ